MMLCVHLETCANSEPLLEGSLRLVNVKEQQGPPDREGAILCVPRGSFQQKSEGGYRDELISLINIT